MSGAGGMLLLVIVFVPALAAALAWSLPTRAMRGALLLIVALVHVVAVAALWWRGSSETLGGWLAADPLGLVVLSLVSVLFLVLAHYAVGYLRDETPRGGRAFVSCLLTFLAAASVVALSQHVALLWVGMESTTLAVAPLIYHRHDRRSLEAVWKYLVLSSVGIALALLAVFLLATSQPSSPGMRPLMLPDLVAQARSLDPRWLRAAFVFATVGFGTKMGLAPLHTWKPDTYGEAPSLVSGLMAGALTSCAFLGLTRFTQVAVAAELQSFTSPILIALGLFSLLVAAAFIIGQADVKRLLAYSSVEHMGLLVLGVGLGGVGAYGSVLHLVNNGLAKAALFLVVGNLVLAAGSSVAADMRGALRVRPASAVLLLAGLFAVTGSPPFGLFISEITIVSAAVHSQPWVAVALIALLSVIFIGIAGMMVQIVYGTPTLEAADVKERERPWLIVGPAMLSGLVLALGLYIPSPLREAIARAASSLAGHAP
jgi:hydrogenase-4 component F